MAIQLKIVNPIEFDNWDNLLLANEKGSFFHTSAWAKVLNESYNYKPLYFVKIKENQIESLVTMMEVNSMFTGRRGVSLPFTDVCEPILSRDIQLDEVINYLVSYGRASKWKCFELRFGNEPFGKIQSSKTYLGHILDLNSDESKIFSKFRKSTQRNIKKAIKQGVEAKFCYSLDSVREFYKLQCQTRRRHGLPPQPWTFFDKIFQHLISERKAVVVLATYKDKAIAGGVFFHFGDKAIYKFGASDLDHQHSRPNNLVMWEAIKWYASNEYKSFSFGKTEPENNGLLQFKRGWGADEDKIEYYKYDLKNNSLVTETSKIKSSYSLFKKLPLPLLKAAGNFLYRHVG